MSYTDDRIVYQPPSAAKCLSLIVPCARENEIGELTVPGAAPRTYADVDAFLAEIRKRGIIPRDHWGYDVTTIDELPADRSSRYFRNAWQFGVSGKHTSFDDMVTALLALPDGRLAVAGQFTELNSQPCYGVVIVRPDGRIDPKFPTYTQELGIPHPYEVAASKLVRRAMTDWLEVSIGEPTLVAFIGGRDLKQDFIAPVAGNLARLAPGSMSGSRLTDYWRDRSTIPYSVDNGFGAETRVLKWNLLTGKKIETAWGPTSGAGRLSAVRYGSDGTCRALYASESTHGYLSKVHPVTGAEETDLSEFHQNVPQATKWWVHWVEHIKGAWHTTWGRYGVENNKQIPYDPPRCKFGWKDTDNVGGGCPPYYAFRLHDRFVRFEKKGRNAGVHIDRTFISEEGASYIWSVETQLRAACRCVRKSPNERWLAAWAQPDDDDKSYLILLRYGSMAGLPIEGVSVWPGWNVQQSDKLFPLAVDDYGRVYCTGGVTDIGGADVSPWQLYRILPNGRLDPSFATYRWGANTGTGYPAGLPAFTDPEPRRDRVEYNVSPAELPEEHTVITCAAWWHGLLVVGGAFTRYKGQIYRRLLILDEWGNPVNAPDTV